MEMIADILLVAGALGTGIYCFVLARRLSRFNDLETGIGGAVAVLSAQVDDLTRTLAAAQRTASTSAATLDGLTERADSAARKLELLVASLHDLQETSAAGPQKDQEQTEANTPLQLEPMFMRHGRSETVAKQ